MHLESCVRLGALEQRCPVVRAAAANNANASLSLGIFCHHDNRSQKLSSSSSDTVGAGSGVCTESTRAVRCS